MNWTEINQIIRQLLRKKWITTINVLGLGIGLGSVILLTTFIIHEFSFDRFNSKSDRIYRIVDGKDCESNYAMGEAFAHEVPEIENICRITNISDMYTVMINHNNGKYPINSFMAVDPSLFNILDIQMIQGEKPIDKFTPHSVLISDRMAQKYFGSTDVIGKTIEFIITNQKQLLQIAGVFKHLPTYSSFQTGFICDSKIAMDQLQDFAYTLGLKDEKDKFDFYNDWSHHSNFTTLVLIKKHANIASIEKKCSEIYKKHRDELKDGGIHLQPYLEMYLNSEGLDNIKTLQVSKFNSLRIFLSIGILILLVACFNYILISNAEQEQSLKEIACRKVNGASGKRIVTTIMLKSLLVSFISLIPAFLFAYLSLPLFNIFFAQHLEFSVFFKGQYLLSLFTITLLTALLAGTYLSVLAVKTSPSNLLRKKHFSSNSSKYFSKIIIAGQFFVFILMISCMLVMKKQLTYSSTKDMGFNIKNTIIVDLGNQQTKNLYKVIQDEIKKNSHVLECQPTTNFLPPNDNTLLVGFKDKDSGQTQKHEAVFLAPGNIELLGISVLDGESFTETNSDKKLIMINEMASKKYNVNAGDMLFYFQILGIVNNYHNKSIHEAIRPLVILPQTKGYTNLAIKTDGKNQEVISHVKSIIDSIDPNNYCEYELLSDRIDSFYKEDRQKTQIISLFSLVTLVLAFMGLFGFVTLNLSKRTREIGIRKINGSKISEIMLLVHKDFVKWVITAYLFATPIAYYAMNKWLENFAYKTTLSWWVFALTGLFALAIELVTVSWQSRKAATKNPVDALRYE